MIACWSKPLVTLDDLLAFRLHVEALRADTAATVSLPSRLTVRAAAYRAVKERFILGDFPSDPRHAARHLDGTVKLLWREPEDRGTSLLRQTATFLGDLVLDNSIRRAAGLVAGLYGTVASEAAHVMVLVLNEPSQAAPDVSDLSALDAPDQRLAV